MVTVTEDRYLTYTQPMHKDYDLRQGQAIVLKKKHPCGSQSWEIVKVGMNIGIRCLQCGRTVSMSRTQFRKELKRIDGRE